MSIDLSLFSALGELHESQINQISAPATSRPIRKQEVIFPSSRMSKRITSEIDLQRINPASTTFSTTKTMIFPQQNDEATTKQLFEQIKHFAFFEALGTGHLGVQFDEFGQKQLCAKLKFEEYSKNKMLFQEDKKSNGNIYLIYSGEVNLYKQNSEYPANAMQFSDYTSKDEIGSEKKIYLRTESSIDLGQHQTQKIDKKMLSEIDAGSYGNIYKTLKPGDHFGEQWLQGLKTRPFTAITKGFCKLLVLKKTDFYFLRENYDEKRKKLRSILEELTPKSFRGDIYHLVSEIVNIFEEKTFERGSTFIVEGEMNEFVYILADGTCELTKNMRIDESSNLNDALITIKQLLRVAPAYNEVLTICSTHKGTFLGEEILFVTPAKNSFTVKVTSSFVTVFALKKNDFLHRFPESLRKEIEKTFLAKQNHYIQIMETIIAKKYPNLRLSSNSKNLIERPDYNVLNNQIILLPKKHGKVNLKIKRMFRNDKEGGAIVNSERTITPDRDAEGSHEDLTPQNVYMNTEAHDREISMKASLLSKKALTKSQQKIGRKDLNPELVNKKSTENLKVKFGRTHITSDLSKHKTYISTSPIPRIKNLNEKALLNRNSSLNSDLYDEESPLLRSHKDRKNEDKVLGPIISNSDLQHFDYGRFASPTGNIIITTVGNVDRTKTKSVDLSNKNNSESKTLSNMNDEIKDSILEMRELLMGKDAQSKDYLMAKKRLQLKVSTHRPIMEVQKDVSFEKRVNALIKPIKERKLRNESDSQNFSPLHSIQSKHSIKLDLSPLRQRERQELRMPGEFSGSFRDIANCQTDLENKSVLNTGRTEIYQTERTNESIESFSERKLRLVDLRISDPIFTSLNMLHGAGKHRKTSSLKLNLMKTKNKKLEIERGSSLENNKVRKEKINPSFYIRAQSLIRNNDIVDLSLANEEKHNAG